MVVFDGAADALAAALAIQDAATKRGRVALRIGIHVGLVRGRDGDLIGHDVNVASRITDRAPRGGILVSGAVRAGARGVAASFQPARPLAIAARRPIGLFRVDPAGVRASRTNARTNGNGRRAAPRRTPSSRRPS
jgi:adenylate cyclase